MDKISETYGFIKNTACIVCGGGFDVPRAGKIYCSGKCKQFAFYHREEIQHSKNAIKGINESPTKLNLKEFEWYQSITNKIITLNSMKRKVNSQYSEIPPILAKQIEILERALPDYIKKLKPRDLQIEEWSFFKVIYPHLKKEDFLILVSTMSSNFMSNVLDFDYENKKERANPIKTLFQNHLIKIAEGKIMFV